MPKAGRLVSIHVHGDCLGWGRELDGRARLTHDQDGDEHLRPVGLMRGLKSGDELADEKRQHRDHDGERHRGVREHEARHAGGEEAADHRGDELGGDEQGRLAADFQQEAPAEVNPDSEGAPSDADEGHRVHDWFG